MYLILLKIVRSWSLLPPKLTTMILRVSLLFLCTVLVISCNPAAPEDGSTPALTDAEKETIKSEIRQVIDDQIVANSENGTLEGALAPYLDHPEFIGVSNGEVLDYEAYWAFSKEYFDMIDSQKFTEKALLFKFIDDKTVLATYSGSADANMKDGTSLHLEPFAATMLFEKMDGSWVITYTNEAASFSPVMADSAAM